MTTEAVPTAANDWIVFVDGQLYIRGLTEEQASEAVRGWTPPPKKQRGILR